MIWKIHHLLRSISTLLLSIVLSAALPHFAQTADNKQAAKNVTIDIGRLHQGIVKHQDKIRQSDEKKVSVLDELEQIDNNIRQQKEKIATLHDQLLSQEKLITQKEEELKQAEVARDTVLEHLQKRLESFYLMGKTGILNVTFSSRNLPELMLFSDSYKRLISYDRSVIDKYRETVGELQRARQTQELEKSIMQDFIGQAEEEKKALYALRMDKETLLARIKTQKGLYELALKEMHKAESDLGQTLASIKKKQEIKRIGFLLNKGKLPPPVKGTLVHGFGEIPRKGLRKSEKTKGITIKTSVDATVRAVYKGKIVFAGYKRGFGKMVIINHGVKHYTVSSRLDTILVKKGSNVAQGKKIGTTGGMATLFERGLYFQVRHESKPLDPLKWLKSGSYSKK
ncbi:MAG: peptidoglycan DD-metalloendopeptidase family protein [Thermodesulfobacteriota bacterium]|nr:peptidoglycan DD-metalloendopeptidase family protein [Thermodesulfobacteriota bacterium]